MANTKITTNVIADDAVTSDKLGGDLTMPGHVSLADNKELRIGTGNDLVIKHDGSHTTLTNTTGNFTFIGDQIYFANAANNEYLAQFIADGACSLRFNNVEELATVSGGVYIPNKLGIGTNSPGGLPLHLKVSSGDNKLRMQTANKDAFVMELEDSTGNLKLGTNTTAGALVIADAGKVGIGTTSPAQSLDVNGAGIFGAAATRLTTYSDSSYSGIFNGSSLSSDECIFMGGNPGGLFFYTAGAERLRVDGNGRFLFGTNATRTMSGVNTDFFIEGTDYDSASIGIVINANGANDCPALFFGKSRGTSDGSNTVVQNNDRVFSMRMDGSDGTNLEQVAIIEAHVDGTPANNSIPGRMTFMTTNSGSQYATEKMRIDNGGRVTMPSQPAAIYHYTNANQDGAYGYSWPGTGAQNIICRPQGATLNRGSMYNASNGRFTAPIAGIYRYAVHGNLYTNNVNATGYYLIQVLKNGGHYVYFYEANSINNANGWVLINASGIISMAKDDYIQFKIQTNNLTTSGVNGFGFDLSQYTHFEFQLLY